MNDDRPPQLPPLVPRRPDQRKRGTTTERGYGHAHQKKRKSYLSRHPICERCGAAWSKHLHHKDRNTANRDDENLEALCVRCHKYEHNGGECETTG